MKLFNKLICNILVIAFVLSFNLQPLAALNTNDFDVLEIVTSLGIIDDELKNAPEKLVNRELFSDVATNLNYSVLGEKKEITYDEILKTMLSILGYGAVIKLSGDDMKNYIIKANELSILKNISPKKNMTINDLAQLIYNCLDVKLMQRVGYGDNTRFETHLGETLLTKTLKTYKVQGEITENEITALRGSSSIGKNCIKIENVIYTMTNKTLYVSDMIGHSIEGYFRENDNGNYEILYAGYNKNEDITLINADDFIKYDNYCFYFTENKNERKIAISKDTAIIKNGSFITAYNEQTFDIEDGFIEIIKSPAGDKHTVVVTDYENFVVSKINKEDFILYNKYELNKTLSLDKDNKTVIIKSAEGQILQFEDIKQNDVLSVLQSENYVNIVICNKTAEYFEITKISNDEYTTLFSNDEFYSVSNEYISDRNRINFNLGDIATLYINNFGKIAWAEICSDEELLVGCFVKIYVNSGIVNNAQLQIYESDGEKMIYNTVEKVSVCTENGVLGKYGVDKLQDILNDKHGIISYKLNDDDKITYIELPGANKNIKRNSTYKLFSTTESSSKNFVYRLWANTFGGKIYINENTRIFIANSGKLDDIDSYGIISRSNLTNVASYVFDAYASKDKDVLANYMIIYDKFNDKGENSLLSDNFIVTKMENILDDEGISVKKVTACANEVTKEFIAEFKNGITPFDIATDLHGRGIKDRPTYVIKVGDIIKVATDSATNKVTAVQLIYDRTDKNPAFPDSNNGNLVGTIGKYEEGLKNTNPYIISSTNEVGTGAMWFSSGYLRFIYGFVYSIEDGIVTVTTQDLSVGEFEGEQGGYIVESHAFDIYKKTSVYYPEKNGSVVVKTASLNDIRSFKDSGADCSRVLITTNSGDPKQFIIINN